MGKFSQFPAVSIDISKTVADRAKVPINHKQEVAYELLVLPTYYEATRSQGSRQVDCKCNEIACELSIDTKIDDLG